jgi:hypothetical protein
MAEGHDIEGPGNAHRHSRRSVLGAAAAVGMLAPAAPAVLAARGDRQPAGERRPAGEHGPAGRPAEAGAEPAAGGPAAAVPAARGSGDVWGTSASGHTAGVRGNGRWGVIGEGTHTGVIGAGFVGVRGATSIVHGGEAGVGIWAQAAIPGSTALRADGPSEFNGVTTFSRSGVVTVRRGASRMTVSGVQLTADTAILATLQDRVTGLFLHAVETDMAKGSFTIFLSTAADRDVRIGWFALG